MQTAKTQALKSQALKTAGITGLALSTLAGVSLPAFAAPLSTPDAKADAVLARRMAAPAASGDVSAIVKTAGPLTDTQQARLSALSGAVTTRLPLIGSVTVTLPARNLRALAALPFVTHLSFDGSVRKCDEFTVAASGAGAAWQAPYRVTGQGVTVAVVDSGVKSDSKDLAPLPDALQSVFGPVLKGPRLLAQVSFATDAQGKTLGPDDQCGHGTHVAGIVGGNGTNSYGKQYTRTFLGVAPQARLVSVRVLDANGGGSVSGVLAGIQWAVQNKAQYKIKVLNLSLGHPVGESYTTDPLCQAVEAAWRAGITVVCAAGNEGRLDAVQDQPDNEGWGTAYGSIQSPANDPYVITVGATKNGNGTRAHDRIATYSSRGPSRLDLVCKPDLVAPGNQIISLDAQDATLDRAAANQLPLSAYSTVKAKDADQASKNYFRLSGTSMSAPVVAGAAALLLQADPTLSPDTIKARLMLGADKPDGWCDAGGSYDPCTYGAGYLNIPAALSSTFTVAGEYAISPSLSVDADGNVSVNDDHALWGKTTVDSDHALWGKTTVDSSHALWGKSTLLGSTGVADLHALWGSHALWGKNTLASSHALWGSSVWGDHALWGSAATNVDLTSTALQGE